MCTDGPVLRMLKAFSFVKDLNPFRWFSRTNGECMAKHVRDETIPNSACFKCMPDDATNESELSGPLRRKSSVGPPSRDSGHFDNPLRRDSAPP